MKSSQILATLAFVALSAAILPAQMGVCGGLNHFPEDPHDDYVLMGGVKLAVQLTLELTASIERAEWLFSSITGETVNPGTVNHGAGGGTVDIRSANAATGMPDAILASGSYVDAVIVNGIPTFPVGGWHGATFANPVVLTNGVPYWVTFEVGPPGTQVNPDPYSFLAKDIVPTQPTPYTFSGTGGVFGWLPVQTDVFFKLRVLSSDCASSAPLASADPIGIGCGGVTLTSFGTPALGSPSFGIQVQAPANVPAAVLQGAPAPRGGIQLSTSCSLYLDPVSIVATPVLIGMTNQAGIITLATTVPPDLSLLGIQFTIQAAVLVQNGPVGIGLPGYGLVLTEGMHITVGF